MCRPFRTCRLQCNPHFFTLPPSVVRVEDLNNDGLDEFAVIAADRGEILVVPGSATSYGEIAQQPPRFPAPTHEWLFVSDATDSAGAANGTLEGDAFIANGAA